MPEDHLLKPEEVAAITRKAVTTLANERYRGVGIPFVRLGRMILYRHCDVTAYIEANIYSSTLEKTSP